MEVFVDFGLFELLAVIGIGTLARAIYSRRVVGIVFLLVSAAAPLAMLEMVSGPKLRWAGTVSAATAIVNIAVVAAVMQEGRIPRLRLQRHRQRVEPSHPESGQPVTYDPGIPALTRDQEPVAAARSGKGRATAR